MLNWVLKRFFFLVTPQTFYFFKVLYIIRLLKSVISLKYFNSFNSSNILSNILQVKHVRLIINSFDLLNTIDWNKNAGKQIANFQDLMKEQPRT